ncbi:Na+/H+ antiporter NhaA [Buchananella hordeovulneris]|uniref:Na+/H+ antiporter NhaA n=1 Tax=Buchananella hordeovulneris TaxID=52770 RepID=UPI0026DD6309|nr:Na+/H+ antiporter NhaA [Buchananella hordeovulneris]MDO5081404.1 Na+/H+ antiporter NhaA [Buchananella hordeovulneris]
MSTEKSSPPTRRSRHMAFDELFDIVPGRLRDETFAGLLVLSAAALALVLANTGAAHWYHELAHYHVGPASLGLNLSLAHWAADGLLAIFFFVIGLELKTEFTVGSLRDTRQAALPMIAAVFGMIGPALIYVGTQLAFSSPEMNGWAIPSATDIAFAVAVLGIVGRGLPSAVRTFLLTLAVVDDLLAIIVIALFYSESIQLAWLGASLATTVLFAVLVRKRIFSRWLLLPLGVLAWYFMLRSGIHATIAGVILGLVVPARRHDELDADLAHGGRTHHVSHRIQPWSAGIALPIFAFFAAGVTVVGTEGGIGAAFSDPVAIGIYLGLPLGKFLGIAGSVWLLVKFTPLTLGKGVIMKDVAAIGLLSGIGFTVALLVAGLAFPGRQELVDHASIAVIIGSVLSALLGGLIVHHRAAEHRRLDSAEQREDALD